MTKQKTKLKPLEILQRLDQAKTDKTKHKIITDAWISDNEEFFLGLQYAFDNTIKFNITSVPAVQDDDEESGSLTFIEFIALAKKISSPNITIEAASKAVNDAALRANIFEWNLWYRRILQKTLQKHISEKIINDCLTALTTH
jgi:hypothetical protein